MIKRKSINGIYRYILTHPKLSLCELQREFGLSDGQMAKLGVAAGDLIIPSNNDKKGGSHAAMRPIDGSLKKEKDDDRAKLGSILGKRGSPLPIFQDRFYWFFARDTLVYRATYGWASDGNKPEIHAYFGGIPVMMENEDLFVTMFAEARRGDLIRALGDTADDSPMLQASSESLMRGLVCFARFELEIYGRGKEPTFALLNRYGTGEFADYFMKRGLSFTPGRSSAALATLKIEKEYR
jgi:hypothetical protein